MVEGEGLLVVQGNRLVQRHVAGVDSKALIQHRDLMLMPTQCALTPMIAQIITSERLVGMTRLRADDLPVAEVEDLITDGFEEGGIVARHQDGLAARLQVFDQGDHELLSVLI